MKVDVVVTRKGLLGKAAGWFGLMWSHAALRYKFEIIRSEACVIEAGAFGIKDRPWEDFIAGVDEYQILRVKDGLTLEQRGAILGYALGNVGKPYNFLWLLKIAWDLLRKKFSILHYPAHVCSSFVDACFTYAGIDLVPSMACVLVLPDDLASSPLLEQAEPRHIGRG